MKQLTKKVGFSRTYSDKFILLLVGWVELKRNPTLKANKLGFVRQPNLQPLCRKLSQRFIRFYYHLNYGRSESCCFSHTVTKLEDRDEIPNPEAVQLGLTTNRLTLEEKNKDLVKNTILLKKAFNRNIL